MTRSRKINEFQVFELCFIFDDDDEDVFLLPLILRIRFLISVASVFRLNDATLSPRVANRYVARLNA